MAATREQPAVGLREQKKADVRLAILHATERLFREHGFDATSMADIAAAANISRKTLFNYVESKESLVLNLVDAFIGEHMPDWVETEEPYYHDARDVLTTNIDARLDDIANHRWLLTLAANHTSFFSLGRTQYVTDALQTNIVRREKRIATVQREGGMRSDIPADEISRYYETWRDLSVGNWLRSSDESAAELHRLFYNSMRVLIRGLQVS